MSPDDELRLDPVIRIQPDQFPAAAFITVCAIVGGAVNHYGSWSVLNAIHLRSPESVGIFTFAGTVGGVTAALWIIRWIARQES